MLGNKEERQIQDVCVPNVAAKFSSAENELFKQAFKTTVTSAHCTQSLLTRAHDMDIEFITALAIGAGQSDVTSSAQLQRSSSYSCSQTSGLSESGNTLTQMCRAIGPNNCVKHSKSSFFVVGALTNAAFYWFAIIAATEKIVASNAAFSGVTTSFPDSPVIQSNYKTQTSTAAASTQNSDDSCVSSLGLTVTNLNLHSLFDKAKELFVDSGWSVNLCTGITDEKIIKNGLA